MPRVLLALLGAALLVVLWSGAQDRASAATPGATSAGWSVPPGFSVTLYAQGLERPRLLEVAASGDVFYADTEAGILHVLPDRNRDGRADSVGVYARGLNRPYALALYGGWLYVSTADAVVRFPFRSGDLRARGSAQPLLKLPPAGSGNGTPGHTLAFSADSRLFVGVPARCEGCTDTDPQRASVWVYTPDGRGGRPYASGLRAAADLEWLNGRLFAPQPAGTGQSWPGSLARLGDGAFYGWPLCFPLRAGAEQVRDPVQARSAKAAPDLCGSAQPAHAVFGTGGAPLGLAAAPETGFPAPYAGQIFVALRGNAGATSAASRVPRVVAVDPQTGQVRDFLKAEVRAGTFTGRPADVAVARDGALLVSDDLGGRIWRVQARR